MAKRQVRKYVFVPGGPGVGHTGGTNTSGYIIVEGKQDLYKLLLITNVTRGTILYNFADSANTGATVTFKPGGIKTSTSDTSVVTYNDIPIGSGTVGTAQIQNTPGSGETYIYVTGVDTSTHDAADKLSIFVEESFSYVKPWNDFGTDAIERARVALPTSQIDADFEYGLQATKWQGFELCNQYPSVYEIPGGDLTLASQGVTSSMADPSIITVYSNSHGLAVNDPFTVQGLDPNALGFTRAQGSSVVFSANTNAFSFYAKGNVAPLSSGSYVANASILSPRTLVRKGGFYSSADLPASQFSSNGGSPSSITIHFSSPHGFVPGMPLIIGGDPTFNGGQFTNLVGSYYANSIPTAYQVEFTARGSVTTGGNVAPNSGTNKLKVYTRNDGFFTHRPGDGGVLMGTASPTHGASTTRQSKKYFRYQSGKGLLYTTGVLFAPNYDITAITVTNYPAQLSGIAILRITTSVPHGCQIGAVIRVTGCIDSTTSAGFNAQYTVTGIVSDVQLDVLATNDVTGTAADISQVPKLYMYQWHGSCIRTGPHDDANGMFFEYDGKYFNVVRRTSTLQLAGTVTFTSGSNTLTGVNTLWDRQLKIGDRVVIKGMVHKVNFVTSATSISVTPDFRGAATSSGNYMWKVQETRTQQPNFNFDTADGNGPSGYKMDPNHLQMVGIQFTWYGAGFMDYMVRGVDGNFIILHRYKQNNINVTASMRSANLPVRYEINNEASNGVVALRTSGGISPTDTSCAVSDVTFFPDTGFIYMNYELIRYGSINRNDTPYPRLVSLTRTAGANVFIGGSYRTIFGRPDPTTHGAGSGIELVSLTASPNMSHWGSSYIMDGGFDFDRGYAFSYTLAPTTVTSVLTARFGIRLAPSASNGLVGDLGVRELLNRAQLLLQNIDVTTGNTSVTDGVRTAYSASAVIEANAAILVQGILNPSNYNETSESWIPLNATAYGNQPSFTQVAITPTFTSGVAATGGEKIFEFLSSPGQLNQLDLTGIKELTQSAVGGRGTFPNGSDSLYINVVLAPAATGTRIMGNVTTTLRWNEAQA
jgi:heat shock protein HslJ